MFIGCQVDIETPVKRLWMLLNDHKRLGEWMPMILETRPGEFDAGDETFARLRHRVRLLGRIREYEGWIAAQAPPDLLVAQINGRAFDLELVFELRPLGTGTRLDYGVEIAFRHPLRAALAYLMTPWIDAACMRDMRRLKQLAESDPHELPVEFEPVGLGAQQAA